MSGVGRNMWPFAVPLFLILLRHNWHTSLCRFKSFSAMVWFTYIVKWLPQSVEFSSVAQSCLTLCDPMDCSTPGLLVYRQLLEFTQTYVRWVGDAIQPSHPLLSPSPSIFDLSQHRGLLMSQLFASGGQSIGVSALTTVLPVNIQDWSSLGGTGWISLQSKGLSRVFSNTTVQKHQFFGTQLSL